MIKCDFLPVVYEHHLSQKHGRAAAPIDNYHDIESAWLDIYGLGRFETLQFIYASCTSVTHLQQWIIDLKGAEHAQQAADTFRNWRQQKGRTGARPADLSVLTDSQFQDWKEQGYIRVSGLVEDELCDAAADFIIDFMQIDMADPATWYRPRSEWHGLMVQQYQHPTLHAIRTHPKVKQLFSDLYGTDYIIPQTDKVSFNPPETATWKFAHHLLHWDVDFSRPDPTYIQGLIYLNDVPEERGPLKVVPGFHKQFLDWIKTYPDSSDAHEMMRKEVSPVPVPGKKGDIVLWLQPLPHAASVNHSDLPRFVQYLSFRRL